MKQMQQMRGQCRHACSLGFLAGVSSSAGSWPYKAVKASAVQATVCEPVSALCVQHKRTLIVLDEPCIC